MLSVLSFSSFITSASNVFWVFSHTQTLLLLPRPVSSIGDFLESFCASRGALLSPDLGTTSAAVLDPDDVGEGSSGDPALEPGVDRHAAPFLDLDLDLRLDTGPTLLHAEERAYARASGTTGGDSNTSHCRIYHLKVLSQVSML